jgi:hypothetical protein
VASGTVVNFDNAPTGRLITNQYAATHGVTFSCDNYRATGPDKLVIFKSDRTGTPDLDLEYPWTAGNLAAKLPNTPAVHLDKILIIAEDLLDFDNNGLIDHPDDEAQGGSMFLKFNTPMSSIGFDVIDVELTPQLDSIEFLFQGQSLKTISFDQFTNPASPYYDPTIVWADRSANRIAPLTAQQLGIRQFDAVTFRFPECAAIDNLTFLNEIAVPEPATAGVTMLALASTIAFRRRRAR